MVEQWEHKWPDWDKINLPYGKGLPPGEAVSLTTKYVKLITDQLMVANSKLARWNRLLLAAQSVYTSLQSQFPSPKQVADKYSSFAREVIQLAGPAPNPKLLSVIAQLPALKLQTLVGSETGLTGPAISMLRGIMDMLTVEMTAITRERDEVAAELPKAEYALRAAQARLLSFLALLKKEKDEKAESILPLWWEQYQKPK